MCIILLEAARACGVPYSEYNFAGAFAVASLLTLVAALTLAIKTVMARMEYKRR